MSSFPQGEEAPSHPLCRLMMGSRLSYKFCFTSVEYQRVRKVHVYTQFYEYSSFIKILTSMLPHRRQTVIVMGSYLVTIDVG